ncbi:MAG: PQQ-binding-like beta-propeller repeat protein [Phycisphaerales bacterium]
MSRRTVLSMCALGTIAGTAMLAGCTGPETHSPGRAKSAEQRRREFPMDYAEYAKIGYRLDWWGYPMVTGSLPVRFMEPYKDIVVTLEQGSQVSILEAGTGGRRCSDQLATTHLTRFVGVVRDGERVLCASDADVYVVDPATCNLAGRQKIEKIVASEPVLFGDLLIFGTGTGELLAHMTRSGVGGVKAWGFAVPGAIERRPVVIGTAVGAVSQTGEVLFVDGGTGSLVGRSSIYGGLATDPVTDGQLMYVASLDQSIYAFSPVGASMAWRVRTSAPLRAQPTVHGGRLYVTVPGQGLTAYDTTTGQPVWTSPSFNGTVVALNKKKLVGFDRDRAEAVTIDLDRGDVIERAKTPGVVMLKPDAFEDGNLYAVSGSGVVAKFQPR